MRNAHGYMELGQADGTSKPYDTVQCGHCGRHQTVKPKQDPATMGGFCRCCMTYSCSSCVDGPCSPFMKKIEAAEERDRSLRSMGIG